MNPLPLRLLPVLLLLAAQPRAPAEHRPGAAGQVPPGSGARLEPSTGSETGEAAYADTPARLVPYRRSAGPHRSLYLTAPTFRGPGREKREPDGLEAVLIGLLAPLEGRPDAPLGRNLRDGVELAFEEANAAGGYRGLPFRLVARNDQALWGSSSNTLVDLAYADRVWAVIGSIDSNSSHVALRVALKAEIPILNVGSSDPTLTETGIPWIVRCTPDDRQTGYRLAQLLFEERSLSRVAVLRSTDRYGRLGVAEFRDAARRLQRPLPMEILFSPGQEDFTAELERLEAAGVEAVVLWSKAGPAGRIVRQMRMLGMSQPIVGTDRLATRRFLDVAAEAAEGLVATRWLDPDRQEREWLDFRGRFASRYARDPDAFAAYGYDAARLLVDAVRLAGLNRARLRDALAGIRSYHGVAGMMHFDATSNNISMPHLARVKGGRFVGL